MSVRFQFIFLLCFYSFFSNAQNLDIRLYDELYADRNKSYDDVMKGFTISAYPIAIAVPAFQVISGLMNNDAHSIENGLQTATGLIVNTALVYSLKYTIKRDRPYITHPEYQPEEYDNSPSFPSGHTSFAFATATSLSLQHKDWYVVAPAFLWAAGVGYSRLHAGAHYPSDVLAGALIGAGSAYLSYKGNQWLRKMWGKKTAKERNIEL